jgi:hypothetical protein
LRLSSRETERAVPPAVFLAADAIEVNIPTGHNGCKQTLLECGDSSLLSVRDGTIAPRRPAKKSGDESPHSKKALLALPPAACYNTAAACRSVRYAWEYRFVDHAQPKAAVPQAFP